MKRFCLILVAAVAIGGAMVGTSAAAEKGNEARERANAKKGLAKATVSLGGAVQMALTKVPGSKAVEAFLVMDADDFNYQVEVISNGKHKIVVIDAVSSQVKKVSDESVEENPEGETARHEVTESEAATADVQLGQAIDAALSRFPGSKAFEAEPTKHGEKLNFEVQVIDGNKVQKVTVSSATGAVVQVEDEGSV